MSWSFQCAMMMLLSAPDIGTSATGSIWGSLQSSEKPRSSAIVLSICTGTSEAGSATCATSGSLQSNEKPRSSAESLSKNVDADGTLSISETASRPGSASSDTKAAPKAVRSAPLSPPSSMVERSQGSGSTGRAGWSAPLSLPSSMAERSQGSGSTGALNGAGGAASQGGACSSSIVWSAPSMLSQGSGSTGAL